MLNKQNTRSPKDRASNAKMQSGESDLVGLLDKVEHLQVVLSRFLSPHKGQSILYDRDPAQLITRNRTALEAIGDDIRYSFASRTSEKVRYQSDKLKNEYGRIHHVSV